MNMTFTPLTPTFAAEVSGIDLTRPLTAEQVKAIDDGMDRWGVLVFHDQRFDDETQLAFSRNFGALEISSGAELSKPEDNRLRPEMADISNLDVQSKVRGAEDKKRLGALGNRLWHSDASFRAVPAKYSLLSARIVPPLPLPSCAAVSREARKPRSTPSATIGWRAPGTPSSSKPKLPSPPGVVASEVTFMAAEPYCSVPRSRGWRKLVPA